MNDVPLPSARPLSIPAAESGGGKTADIIAANAGSDNRVQPIQENVPLPQARPESAPTAASVQEAAQQPPLERLANPDAKPWNSLEENSGNPYNSGGQKLVTLTCSGGGGVCGPDQKITASGSTASGEWIAVPANNSQGIKLGDKVDVQVGDKVIQNVMVADYTPSNRNNYVVSGELEKSLGGTGRDAALITPSAPEVPLPTPRPQDIDASGNTISPAAAPVQLESELPRATWTPEVPANQSTNTAPFEDGYPVDYANAPPFEEGYPADPKQAAIEGYQQTPPDQLNPSLPESERINPYANETPMEANYPESQSTVVDSNVPAPEAKEPDLSVADLSYLNQFEPNDLLLSNEQIAENIANDQAARSFASETGGEGELSQTAADSAPAKETTAATAIQDGENIPLPQSRPDLEGAKKEALDSAQAALRDVKDNTNQLEKVVKNPNSSFDSFKSAGNEVLQSLKESKPALVEAKQAALDAGDKTLANKIQTSIDQVNTSIAGINTARNQIQKGINEALKDPAQGG